MMPALLLVLTWAAVVSTANYVEYSGIKMPHYGSNDYEIRDPPRAQPSDDYHTNLHDAPASPEYKDEEESRSTTESRVKEFDDSDLWRKHGRRQRELASDGEPETRARNFIIQGDDNEISKSRSNRVNPKHRPRLKNDMDTDELPVPRSHSQFGRNKKLIVSKIDRDYQTNEKITEFEEDLKEDDKKKTNHRNFKDRPLKKSSDDRDYYEEHPREKSVSELMERKAPSRYRPPQIKSHIENISPVKMKLREYNDYDDYYDMKRVNSMKNRLPTLLQRTTDVTSPRVASVAERELKAALYEIGARRLRKEVLGRVFTDAELGGEER